MKSLQTPDPVGLPPEPPNQSGPVVWCIHCFRTLGAEDRETSRASLLSNHNCIESQMAKRPAAPPPYN